MRPQRRALTLVTALLALATLGGCAGGAGVEPTASGAAPPTTSAVTSCGARTGRVEAGAVPDGSLSEVANRYRVYLPPCYDQEPDVDYPTLYVLHGSGDDGTMWDGLGVDEAADSLIASGEIAPLVIVIPNGGPQYGGGFVEALAGELIPHVDATYRTRDDGSQRAVGGISLGGRVALEAVAAHGELFGAYGDHSGALGRVETDTPGVRALIVGRYRVWLDVGTDDGLRSATEHLDEVLTEVGVAHELHLFPGAHVGGYWGAHMEDYLRFYAAEWS